MKKIIVVLILTLSVLSFSFADDGVSCAKSSIVMDVNTGRILYSKNSNIKLPMASTTKIITTLLAIENTDIDDVISISKNASIQEGSSVYLKEGEKLILEDLLYCIMLRSGNDASVAVAEHISGSVKDFAGLMNSRAKEIGAKNTNFTNPHGLPDDNHYTTSYDLALITREALKNPTFSKIVRTKRYTITRLVESNRILENKNKMLWQYPEGTGVKTGYTKKAGKCLVSSAEKSGWEILTVVLNCNDMWNDSMKLLDYGFTNYDYSKIVDKDILRVELDVIKGKEKAVEIIPENDLYGPILKIGDGYEKLDYVYNLPKKTRAPIKKQKKAGTLKIFSDNFLLGQVDLLYNNDIESSDIAYHFKKILKNLIHLK